MSHSPHSSNRALAVIAGFNLFKGLLFLIVTAGILHFLHKDLGEAGERLVRWLHCDPDNQHVISFLNWAGMITDKQLKQWSGITFLCAGLFLTEGTGLLMRKQWAKYLTIIATSSLVPIEIYELAKHPSLVKVIVLIGNLAIVAYLINNVRREGATEQTTSPTPVVPDAVSS